MECDFTFVRTSTFYQEGDGNYEKKTCEFSINSVDDGGEKTPVGYVRDFDMSVYVGKTDEPCTIEFDECDFPETSIKVEWTI